MRFLLVATDLYLCTKQLNSCKVSGSTNVIFFLLLTKQNYHMLKGDST